MFVKSVAYAAAVCTFAASAHAATIIDNADSIDAVTTQFGSSNTATYGQTLTGMSSDMLTLEGFSLFLAGRFSGAGTLDLRGYVAEWDGAKASNILYTSDTRAMNAEGTAQEFAFDTDGLSLTEGADYVFFLSISELPAQATSLFAMPTDRDGAGIANGSFVFINNGTDFSQLTTVDWSDSFSERDARFRAEFSDEVMAPVPLPAGFPLALAGLGALGLLARRKAG